MIVGWRCAVCGHTLDVATVAPFRCPRRTEADPHHVLHPLTVGDEPRRLDDPNPFVAYGPRLGWWAFARANGMTEAACTALTRDVAAGFTVTPFARHDGLGLAGELWVKDETTNVGGSHKGRHLVTVLLHLCAAEALHRSTGQRRPLAIASCGNAAIAAATLAQRVGWPLDVFVPTWASADVLGLIESHGPRITVCPRRPDDPPGDPTVHRCREAVAGGAVPFTVQGPENALCLDGGRTIGWELADAGVALDRVVVQVGGGAFAACVGWGLGAGTRLDTVQTEGCAPLARAWARAADRGIEVDQFAAHWSTLMTPWDDPHSAADGIIDDETYDWLAVSQVMARSGGRPLVAAEDAVDRAHALLVDAGFTASPTGTAGLAGLSTADGAPTTGERVAIVVSGVAR